jgi:hypothetical protein
VVHVTIAFEKIAPYLKDPLVLIGFFLFLAFLFCRYLIQRGIIPALPPTLGFRILRTILLYGFILGLLLILLGFGLKYKQTQDMNKREAARLAEQTRKDENERKDRLDALQEARERDLKEQEDAVSRLDIEFNQNLAVADQLRRNTIVLAREFKTLTSVTRTPGIKLLALMFPAANLDLRKANDVPALNFGNAAMDQIRDSGLLANELERQKLTAAAQAITSTIDATLSTARSLEDPDRTRYQFTDAVWRNDQQKLAEVIVTDLGPYQESYGRLSLLRSNYDVLGNHLVEYLTSLHDFFDPAKHLITRESLQRVLTNERYTSELLTQYGKEMADQMAQLRVLQSNVEKLSAKRAHANSAAQN